MERDIWGNRKERKGTGEDLWEDSLRFGTYPYDPVTGRHFAHARIYDGTLGRMHAKDPVKRGLNGYPYCDNDPVNHVDPDGEFAHVVAETLGGAATGGVAGFVSSAISQRKSGEKFSLKKALGAAAEGAVTGGAKGAMLSSGFGAAAMFAGDLASGTAGNMLNRAISGKKQNLGESLWGGLTNAVSGLAGGSKAVKSAGQAFRRGFADGAATSAMNYIHDTALAGNASAGSRSAAGASMAAAGMSVIGRKTSQNAGSRRDPRSTCGTGNVFSGGIGSQRSRGYRQTGNSRRSGTKSGFSLGGMLKSALLGGLAGGLTGTAMYGTGKALDAVAGSIVAERRNKNASFRDMMNPKEAERYDAYWKQGAGSYKNITENGKTQEIIICSGNTINTRQRLQTNPGTRSIVDVKYSKNGEMYYRETIFDRFGRRIGNNDFTDHGTPNVPSHTNPHYHPNSPLNPQAHGNGISGLHPSTP